MAGVFNLELQDDPEIDEELTDEEYYCAESQQQVSKGDNWSCKLVVTFVKDVSQLPDHTFKKLIMSKSWNLTYFLNH